MPPTPRFVSHALLTLALTLALALPATHLSAHVAAAQSPREQSPTAQLVTAADAFLASLDDAQRARVLFDFDDDEQRARWSNLPPRFFPRSGVSFGELNASQRNAATQLLDAALSDRGFEKVRQIVQAGDVLEFAEQTNPMFGGDHYYFSILGTPSQTSPWMLQYGGHHLAINLTIDGERGILTPSLTGAQPATYELFGKTVRPLGQESDKAFALLHSLDHAQREQAILDYRVADLVLGPGHDGRLIYPEGLSATAMNSDQRDMLMDLISEWTNIVHETAAQARLATLEADLDHTWFAWSGPTTFTPGQNGAAYYRIQGPRVVIEYAPQGSEDPAMHIHCMYRDPTNDYGRRPTRR